MKHQHKSAEKPSILRIVGGKWRSRKIFFYGAEGLRPTSDRVRETLFNWLAPTIEGSHCLDAFAGSGALTFEALSRGAASVVTIDESAAVIANLKKNAETLKAEHLELIQAQFPQILSQLKEKKFDIVFIDPPFRKDLINISAQTLEASGCLKANALIFMEIEQESKNLALPENWEIIRDKKAGQVRYFLILRK